MDEAALDKHYQEYVARLAKATGKSSVDPGAFVKNEGRLVKALSPDEFGPVFTEYQTVAKTYLEAIDRGDTINDMVVRMLREKASELFLESPV